MRNLVILQAVGTSIRYLRRLVAYAVLAMGLLVLLPGDALAHAHLIRADLAPDSDLTVPAGIVHFWFDEPLNGALSQVVIKDAGGRQVNIDTGQLDPSSNQELDVFVPTLDAGQYTVLWTSDSAQDGHILHGFYVFTVGGSRAHALGSLSGVVQSDNAPGIDSTSLVSALAHWLVLVASTLWTGALAFELLVLVAARARARGAIGALANGTSERIAAIVQLGLLATLVASLIELEAQAHASGGSILSVDVVRDILHSHYGAFWLVRLACVFLVQVALMLIPTSPSGRIDVAAAPKSTRAVMFAAGVLGGGYLLALAMSGHADAVSQMVATSVLLDWLHLLANAAWLGGMSAIALALIPAFWSSLRRSTGDGNDSRLAFLVILDRFSPVALVAVPTAMFTGMFNAQVHLDSLDAFFNSQYGRFLIVKLLLIAAIICISATHVVRMRPRVLGALAGRGDTAIVEPAFVSLTRRLALEPLLGAGILLCVALMGETAPAVTVFATPVQTGGVTAPIAVASPTPQAPASIHGQQHKGLLDIALTVDPAAVGHARLLVTVHERGKVVTDGQVRVKLSVPGNSTLGAAFVETTPSSGGYSGSGDLVQNGRWQADVLVRTHSDPLEYRDIPFQFVAGPGAGFLPPGLDPSTMQIAITPGKLNTANTLLISRLPATEVQVLSESLDMDMGAQAQSLQGLGNGRWRATGLYVPMEGRWSLTVQMRIGGAWISVRQFIYRVPAQGSIRLVK